jgi:hypothetical protein
MRAKQLTGKSRVEDGGLFSRPEHYDNHEQRLTESDCSGCGHFEAKAFCSKSPSREPDEYTVCRLTKEPVDRIWDWE